MAVKFSRVRGVVFAMTLGLIALCTQTASAVDGTWAVDADGNWSLATNWSSNPSVPGGQSSTVGLTFDITGAHVVTIDSTSRTVGVLSLGDAVATASATYTLNASGGASLIMDNNASAATITQTVNSAGDTISAPILLNGSLNIANASTTISNVFTISGSISSNTAGAKTITENTGQQSQVLLSGVISDGAGVVSLVQLTANVNHVLTISGANTYTGSTSISRGGQNSGTGMVVSSLGNWASGNTLASNLGSPQTLANGAINFGTTTVAGILNYTGAGQITNRSFNLAASSTGGGVFNNNGTNSVVVTGKITSNTASAKTFTLGGTFTGTSVISGVIENGSGTTTNIGTSGAGIWVLDGNNTFTGTVSTGTATASFTTAALSVSSLNYVTTGTWAHHGDGYSNLGAPTDSTSGTITVGGTGNTAGTLIYTGAGETTDRIIKIVGNGNTAIQNDGTGDLNFTSNFSEPTGGAHTFFFQGISGGTISGPITNTGTPGIISLTKAGAGTWNFASMNTYTGTTSVTGGTLNNTATATSGTPWGTGAVSIINGTLGLTPGGSGSDVALTGGTLAAATTFTYNPGSTLFLNRGNQLSLTYTFGTSGTTFVRGTNGTLIISASDITKLGETVANNGERFIITGTAPTATNGVVAGAVGQDRTNGNNLAGDFLTYDATNGFKKTTYTLTDTFSGSTNASVINIANATPTSGATAAYALKVGATTVTNTGNTITLGATGSTTSGLILNGGTISGGIVTTPTSVATELAVYVSSAGGTISANVNSATSQAGMSVFGPGTLTLSAGTANTFTGGLRINGATVSVSNDNQLGGSTSSVSLIGGTLKITATTSLGGAGQRSIGLVAGMGSLGGTIDVADTTTTTFQNATSKVISGTGGLIKAGLGTLVLSGSTTNTYTGGTYVNAGTLQLGANNMLVDTAPVVVNGGTFDIQGNNDTVGNVTLTAGSITGSGGVLTTPTGKSYDVRKGTVSAILAGTGGLTKTTADLVTLSGANTYTGFTRVRAGTLKLTGAGAKISSTQVEVESGATLQLEVVNTLSDSAVLTLDKIGAVYGTAALNYTGSEAVGTLILDNVQMGAGTYGSTTSGAQFTDDNYFSGTGVILVPEPATLSLVALTAVGLLSRRRRR